MIALRAALLAFVLLCATPALTQPARAQDDEDHQRLCPLLTEELVRTIMPEVTGHGGCDVRCAGCGCKGGPGYRDAQGQCVGYANLIQKCGPPPHLGCRAECAPVSAGCEHGRVWLKGFLARSGLSVQFTAGSPPRALDADHGRAPTRLDAPVSDNLGSLYTLGVMPPPLLTLQDIHLTFGTTPLLSGAALSVSASDRVCLVGRNGSGKSTLLRIAGAMLQSDSGRRFVQPGATIRYLPQEPDFSEFGTTLAYVEAGFDEGAAGDRHRASYLLEQLGLTGSEDPSRLSGGEARRAALARVLAPEPDILLLDEPTNHLDLPGIEWLERELNGLRSGIVLISHDRRLLERLSRITVWLDRGITRQLDAGFSGFEAWRDTVLEQEESERHKLGRKIVMEEDWLRYGVTARRKRNQKRLGDLHALRKKRKEMRGAVGGVKLRAAEGDLSGRLVAVAEGVTKAFGDRVIVRDFSTRILRGDRVGIVGPNGAGKTTLLNLLTGVLAPDTGSVAIGTNLAQVTVDQLRDVLDPDRTLVQTLSGGAGDNVVVAGKTRHVIGYMKDFLFAPEQANTPVGVLSGGERARLTLALAFAKPSNLLVLDEPTNDLDLETLELLQELLADYPGTVLLVSHDRDFIDRVVTSVIATEGDGRWIEYAGGYTDMLSQRGPAKTIAPPVQTRAKAVVTPRESSSKRMTFKDRHALETLPARIATLQAEAARLTAVLEDADLYTRNPVRFAEVTVALGSVRQTLAAAEEQWLELEMLREELER